jgi:hypothetical protein
MKGLFFSKTLENVFKFGGVKRQAAIFFLLQVFNYV